MPKFEGEDQEMRKAPKGQFVVYVGEQLTRFTLPLSCLKNPIFQQLLKKSAEEYGYSNSRGIVLPAFVEKVFLEYKRFAPKKVSLSTKSSLSVDTKPKLSDIDSELCRRHRRRVSSSLTCIFIFGEHCNFFSKGEVFWLSPFLLGGPTKSFVSVIVSLKEGSLDRDQSFNNNIERYLYFRMLSVVEWLSDCYVVTVVNWQCRGWVKSSYVVDMNSLLQSRHERRIQQTPFKWFLEIVDPIELNMKMMKQLVCRWVPPHQSFKVRQEMVPFNVLDVVMTLGLGVGGLEVPFDQTVVGKVGELFNSNTITLKDMITIFNNIVVNEDVDVDVIEDSLSISGAAAVLQLWVYERLSLHGNISRKVFPRILRFRSLDYGTAEIEVLFQKGEVQFDWYLSSSDHQNPIICAALYMGAVGTIDEAPQKGDGSYESALASRVEKIKRNNQRMRNLKDEIAALRKELSHQRKMRKFEQYPSVHVVGQGNEEATAGAAHEATAHVEAAAEQGAHEEALPEGSGHATPFYDKDADEEVGDEESAEQPRTFIDIGEDEEAEVNVAVEPMVVEPLYTFVGDPRETVDVFMLYFLATRKGIVQR
ncbi:hypothetical protein V8G54_024916 [Vigna mungo]|uniref:Uncharacterized protein n=1 Tax=Vigna mungo TaxID=3915 RepID=A0AAQ3N636_VIGMU